ncbi:serine/threonine protein phosphatase [Aquipuribacter nitratireducens]|uniref:Serine/threonine protein phosphatase n=1 Tax=Aquipuribacter nitratireducens TaxID=650104 RepID=A0ABW0GS52_9MICO
MTSQRLRRHEAVAASLAALNDAALSALVGDTATGAVGVGGGSSVVRVGGLPVFVKRVPLTDRELAAPRSTANLFDVPTACQYGMHRLAGPGVSGWRELAANLTVTAGVLAGETDHFALLHHWRVLPGRLPVAAEHRDVEAVVVQFDGAPGVRARLEALHRATASLVLFSEYLPGTMDDWLADPLARAEQLERQLFEMVAFLRGRELLHMDGHFANMRVHDDRVHLVDFGLATSTAFDLTPAERAFVIRNREHDADYAAMRLVNWLVSSVCGLPPPTGPGPDLDARNAYVHRCADGDLPHDVPPTVVGLLARHASAAARMNTFTARLYDGDTDAEYTGPTA